MGLGRGAPPLSFPEKRIMYCANFYASHFQTCEWILKSLMFVFKKRMNFHYILGHNFAYFVPELEKILYLLIIKVLEKLSINFLL